MSTEALKIKLIEKIVSSDDNRLLEQLNSLVDEFTISDNYEKILKLAKPMKKKLNVETLKKEQNFQPIDKEDLFDLFEKLDVNESIEDLISMV